MSEPEQPQPDEVMPYEGDLKGKRLERRALRSRWNIPEQYKAALVKRVVKNGLDPETSARDATQCFRAIVAAEQQDFEKDRAELPVVLEHTGPGGGPVKLEVVETIVRTRQEASHLPPVVSTGEVPRLNGVH